MLYIFIGVMETNHKTVQQVPVSDLLGIILFDKRIDSVEPAVGARKIFVITIRRALVWQI